MIANKREIAIQCSQRPNIMLGCVLECATPIYPTYISMSSNGRDLVEDPPCMPLLVFPPQEVSPFPVGFVAPLYALNKLHHK